MAAQGPQGSSIDEVFGDAISKAVRMAVDTVGRAPFAGIEEVTSVETAPPPGADAAEPVGTPPNEDEAQPFPPLSTTDPYALLGVARSATWEQITAGYRLRARLWHPDGASPEEAERRQDLIRRLNIAYGELRVRRGR